ncbi:MAG: response regulator transcription factor [Planctomycetes bacterium]|nr:response regulator transcription factor [Planctomycetota bacterium]
MISRIKPSEDTVERKVRVLISTHHVVLGELLEEALKIRPQIDSVRRVQTARQVLAASRERRPDVVLLDPSHPIEPMFDLARTLGRLRPPVPVIFMGETAAMGWIYRALDVGASGFLARCARTDDYLRAIQAVCEGQRYFSPSAATVVSKLAAGGELPIFSTREMDVLRLICEGSSTKEIGRDLGLEPKTVDSIRARLMTKTGTKNAASLVRYACDERFVDLRPRSEARLEPPALHIGVARTTRSGTSDTRNVATHP